MSSYSIDPAGVSAVVKDVQDAAGALVEAFSSLESAETDVTNGTSDCAEVAAAVSALLQREAQGFARGRMAHPVGHLGGLVRRSPPDARGDGA
jgi:hypothetical protein